jgi:hypothetical protein
MHARRNILAALALLALAAPGVASASSAVGDALVLRAPGGGGLTLVDASTGRALRSLPAGALSADGTTLLTARVHAGSTLVRRLSVVTGKTVARRTVPGAWSFQRASEDGTLVAGGEHGLAVALVAADRANGYHGTAKTTRIAVLPATLTGRLRVLELPGNFGVDAFGPNGQYLYLIQHLQGEHYKVRAYDLLADELDPQTVVDKGEPNEQMAGLPLARAENSTGTLVLTLYRRPSGVPFVHALMANSLYALCIDLPAAARVDPSAPSSWGVAMQGTRLYLANAASGFVGIVDTASMKFAQSASLGAQTPTEPLTRPLAAASDGTRLYLARPQGLVSIDASTLTASAPLTNHSFGSVVLGTAGTVLYGAGQGATQALDPRTGSSDASPWTTGKLSLVSVVKAA